MLLRLCGQRHGIECQVFHRNLLLLPPQVEEPAVTERQILRLRHANSSCDAVDPLRRAFELGKISNRRLVDYAVPIALLPLGAPLLVAERRNQSERTKHLGQRVAVGDFGFRLDAVFVAVFRWYVFRQALVGQRPAARVAADAQNLSARAHLPVRRVVESVAFKAARGFKVKAGRLEPSLKRLNVSHAEFDLGFDGHGLQRV
jgi:hypothetical protein